MEHLSSIDCTMENCRAVSTLKNHTTPKGEKKELRLNLSMIPTGSSVKFDVEVNGTRLGMTHLARRALVGSGAGSDLTSPFQALAF